MSVHPADRLQATEDLIIHRLAARALRRRRELADVAVAQTRRLADQDRWRRVLQVYSITDICRLLVSRSEEAYQLRQDSPFTRLQHKGLDFTAEEFRRRLAAASLRLAGRPVGA
ncbi:hypothetical protein FY136_28555 (plasmid) [Agrobacterium tumefaciens]|uniref:hypothetical protein n=1 Tax=Agrobacterium tumefaciens TaxID=358 RepID=UPI0021CE5781|nr:hypothetical protein [Agrobacterium tumefaciens]UXT53215.1 hypothetical protein FY136_28555 [Agrobacterium tumefaciens]